MYSGTHDLIASFDPDFVLETFAPPFEPLDFLADDAIESSGSFSPHRDDDAATQIYWAPTSVGEVAKPFVNMVDSQPPQKPTKKRDRVSDVPDEALPPENLAKRMRRRELNKIAAQQSRVRKQERLKELEEQVELLNSKNSELEKGMVECENENKALKDLLSSNGISVPVQFLNPARKRMLSTLVGATMIVAMVTISTTGLVGRDSVTASATRSLKTATLPLANTYGIPSASSPSIFDEYPNSSYLSVQKEDYLDEQKILSLLHLLFPDTPFEHRYSTVDLAKALFYIKNHGVSDRQYLLCPDFHSVTLTSDVNRPAKDPDGLPAVTSDDLGIAATNLSVPVTDGSTASVTLLVPTGIMANESNRPFEEIECPTTFSHGSFDTI